MARRRRLAFVLVSLVVLAALSVWDAYRQQQNQAPAPLPNSTATSQLASAVLAQLPVKGRAPMTGYSRDQFGSGWATVGACDMREYVLARDLTQVTFRPDDNCTVLSGTLDDPYTGKTIHFTRGPSTSGDIQIDHVVALGDAWQKGAQQLTKQTREQLYNDPLELLAVDGSANQQKGDGDAATWLPANKAYRCQYVARQIGVKAEYHLWVTQAEHDAIERILSTCPTQVLPVVQQR